MSNISDYDSSGRGESSSERHATKKRRRCVDDNDDSGNIKNDDGLPPEVWARVLECESFVWIYLLRIHLTLILVNYFRRSF